MLTFGNQDKRYMEILCGFIATSFKQTKKKLTEPNS